MDLWTEFEGATIDSAFALNKLLQTEGRSAFFSTLNSKGESVLIRIIECHFDEDEIMARWRGVQTLGHPNFLRIDHFGQFLIEADDITAVYVVFERVDANLGQVLEQGRLSSTDAVQIGLSVASALETLHTHGFVHEHIEARTIFAIGDNVKLRSDCIRETPEGEAGFEARRRDVHDLAVVLKQVLVGMSPSAYAPRQSVLPAPFEEIVSNGMTGEWGLAEIKAALTQLKETRHAPGVMTKARDLAASPFSPKKPAQPEPRPDPGPRSAVPQSTPRLPFPNEKHRSSFDLQAWIGAHRDLLLRWVAAGALLIAVVFVGWILTHHLFRDHADAAAPTATPGHTAPAPTSTPPAPLHANLSRSAQPARLDSHEKTDWRVVAFTYNRQDQAQKKSSSLAEKHPELRPEVFSPSGRAPWLVTIGGSLQRDAAYALARRARSIGLPRDTYAQNYTSR